MYSHLQDTIDIVQLWDQNVLNNNSGASNTVSSCTQAQCSVPTSHLHDAIMPECLRPAPFDGKRATYTSRQPDQTEARQNSE